MKKGFIVVDMFEYCSECPFLIKDMRLKTGLCAVWENLHDEMRIIPVGCEKPDWCPIRELPERMKVAGRYPQSDKIVPSYKIGWNACLNAIEGKEDKH